MYMYITYNYIINFNKAVLLEIKYQYNLTQKLRYFTNINNLTKIYLHK